MWILSLSLLMSLPGWAGPTVPELDQAQVPEAWRSAWTPYRDAVSSARKQAKQRAVELEAAEARLRTAEAGLASADKTAKKAKKEAKKAKKAKSPTAAAAAAAARTEAAQSRAEAVRAVSAARSDRDLASAESAHADAELALAEARLEQVKAQAVADAGVWIDRLRFDEAVTRAESEVEAAAASLQRARSAAVLTRQGG